MRGKAQHVARLARACKTHRVRVYLHNKFAAVGRTVGMISQFFNVFQMAAVRHLGF